MKNAQVCSVVRDKFYFGFCIPRLVYCTMYFFHSVYKTQALRFPDTTNTRINETIDAKGKTLTENEFLMCGKPVSSRIRTGILAHAIISNVVIYLSSRPIRYSAQIILIIFRQRSATLIKCSPSLLVLNELQSLFNHIAFAKRTWFDYTMNRTVSTLERSWNILLCLQHMSSVRLRMYSTTSTLSYSFFG